MSLNHAVPELLEHLSIYEGEQAILEWHDAFADGVLLSKSIPEEVIAAFSNEFGLEYGEANFS